METDLQTIRHLAKEREDENWLFRTFLKGFAAEDIDSTVHRLFEEVASGIDCTNCGNCCRKIKPSLSDSDIDKLSKCLDVSVEQFSGNYVAKDKDGQRVFNQTPCPFLVNNKCSRYGSRPEDCASYPHLHKKDITFRLIGVIQNYSVCPIVFNVYEALKSELMPDFGDFMDEMDDIGYN